MNQLNQSVDFLYLSQDDVIAAGGLEMNETLQTVERVFAMMDNGEGFEPLSPMVAWDQGEMQSLGTHFGGLSSDPPVAGLKWITVTPSNPRKRNQPSIIDVTIISDPQTGFPLAVMDGTLISARRTGAITGVAAQYLARQDAEVIGLIGLGVITRAQIAALKEILTQIKHVKIFDINIQRAESFAHEMGEELSLPMEIMPTAKETVIDADIVAVATAGVTLADSYIEASWIKPGSLFSIMSSYDAKFEVIAKSNKFVLDTPIQLQCQDRSMGLFYKQGLLKDEDILYLGEIINGKKPGRENDHEKIYFKSWGMSVFDVAEAYRIYHRAKELGIGKSLELWHKPQWI